MLEVIKSNYFIKKAYFPKLYEQTQYL